MTRQGNGIIWAPQRANIHRHHENETTQIRQPLKKKKKNSYNFSHLTSCSATPKPKSQTHKCVKVWNVTIDKPQKGQSLGYVL